MFLLVFLFSLSINLPGSESSRNFIKPCSELTPECLKNSIQKAIPEFVKGIPDLGVETIDPFKVDLLKLSLPGGLIITFINGDSTGYKDAIVEAASLVGATLNISLRMNLTIDGDYISTGRLLLFPIKGSGESTIHCRNINLKLLMKLGTITKNDDKKYLEIKKYKSRHSFDGRVTYKVTNLFQGNPEISNLMLSFMNANWKLVADELGDPIIDFGVKVFMKNIKQFFNSVPLEELIKAPINF